MAVTVETQLVGNVNVVIATTDAGGISTIPLYTDYYRRMTEAAEATLEKVTSIDETLIDISTKLSELTAHIDAIKNRASSATQGIYTARVNGLTTAQQRAMLMVALKENLAYLEKIKDEIKNPTPLP